MCVAPIDVWSDPCKTSNINLKDDEDDDDDDGNSRKVQAHRFPHVIEIDVVCSAHMSHMHACIPMMHS